MEKTHKVTNVVAHVLMALAILVTLYSLFTFSGKKPSFLAYLLGAIPNLIALVCGIIYTAKGSTKSAAKWLKCFEGFAALSLLACIARASSNDASTIYIVVSTLSFGIFCVLCYAENLGKERSYCLGSILLLINVVAFIIALSSKIRFGKVVNLSSNLLIVIILDLLLTHKYQDKERRGAK